MKKLKSILVLLLLVFALVLVVVAGFRYFNLQCGEVKVEIADKSNRTMVSEQQVRTLILNSSANPIGKKVRKYDSHGIEAAVRQNPWIKGVKSISTNGGDLIVTVTTKTPIAWVFPLDSDPLVLADNGQLLADESRCSGLLVINGNIPNSSPNSYVKKKSSLHDAYTVARAIVGNKSYSAQYPEIFVRPDGQLELYSILGGHTILLGHADHLSQKLANLDAAYSNKLVSSGTYKTLDLRFEKRIYASK